MPARIDRQTQTPELHAQVLLSPIAQSLKRPARAKQGRSKQSQHGMRRTHSESSSIRALPSIRPKTSPPTISPEAKTEGNGPTRSPVGSPTNAARAQRQVAPSASEPQLARRPVTVAVGTGPRSAPRELPALCRSTPSPGKSRRYRNPNTKLQPLQSPQGQGPLAESPPVSRTSLKSGSPKSGSPNGDSPKSGRAQTTSGSAKRKINTEAMDPEMQEKSALQSIYSVASGITGDLEKLMRRCDEFSEEQRVNVGGLQQISTTAYKVCEDLDKPQKSSVGVAWGAQGPATYTDPTLERAKKIVTLSNRLSEDLMTSSDGFGAIEVDSAEGEYFLEVTSVTRQVCEDMTRLQLESWGVGVLAGVPTGAEAEDDTKLPTGCSMSTNFIPKEAVEEDDEPELDYYDEPSENLGEQAGSFDRPVSAPVMQKVEGLADLEDFLVANSDEGFSESFIARMKAAFQRFKVPDSNDLYSGDVIGLLRYLGHVMTSDEAVQPILKEITTYDYLDFDEFMAFMAKFLPYEKAEFWKVFLACDEDGSGEISILELKAILSTLGFIPLRAMITEALSVVDQNGNGQLDFDELIIFLAVYRRAEGFCFAEVTELRRIFDHYSQHGDHPNYLLPPDQLGDALIQNFGLHVVEFAQGLEDELAAGHGLQKSTLAAAGAAAAGKAESLSFAEYLIFARKTREVCFEKLKGDYKGIEGAGEGDADADEFGKHDLDNNGLISEGELKKALTTMGYTPLMASLSEVLTEVDKDKNRELDFNEFFDFILIYRQREGFTKAATEEMKKIFNRFDDDGSGEISALELSDLFRHLGYRITLDEVYIFVSQVDANGSNCLDFREYLRLMHLHREDELKNIHKVFSQFEEMPSETMQRKSLPDALAALEHDSPPKALLNKGGTGPLDFDTFVSIVDGCRNDVVAKERKKAGFTDKRIEELTEVFHKFDKDGSGEIDTMELMAILKEFGWEPKTRHDQQELMKKIELARARAKEAGIKNVGKEGSGSLEWWTFVQLSRMLETEHEHAEEERMNTLMADLKFNQKEVDDFRQVFLDKKKEAAEEKGILDESSMPSGLARDAVRRLVKSLGVSITGEKKIQLDTKLTALGCDEVGLLDFFGFLDFMRWIMDTDFYDAKASGSKGKK